jgi:nitrite reductase/ring-hydroxylating ferredoxin subunit
MKTSEGTYTAFDAACPNQALTSCTAMTIDGINAVCSCDKVSYNLFTGQGGQEYPMKQYRVEYSGGVVHVYN